MLTTAPPLVGQTPGHRLLDERQCRPGVEGDRLHQLIPAHGQRRSDERSTADRVDQEVDPAEPLDRRPHQEGGQLGVAGRTGAGHDVEALAAEGRLGGPQPGFGAGIDDHRGALEGQAARRSGSDAGIRRGAGHDGDLALETPSKRALVHCSPREAPVTVRSETKLGAILVPGAVRARPPHQVGRRGPAHRPRPRGLLDHGGGEREAGVRDHGGQALGFGRRHRWREEVALRRLHPDLAQYLHLFGGLDRLGHRADSE